MSLNVFGVSRLLCHLIDAFQLVGQTDLTTFGGCVESVWGQSAAKTKLARHLLKNNGTK